MLPKVLLVLLFLASVGHVCAARSISITGNTSSLLGDDTLTLTASASGFVDGEIIYVKGAFYLVGTTNYFGYTKNGDEWVKNSVNNTSQKTVKIGEWDGNLAVKSDFSDSGYKGEGEYQFKLRYYYGSSLTPDWSTNVLTIGISEPDPTITPTPFPTNTPTNTPTPSPIPIFTPAPSSAPIATVKPTNVPTIIITSQQTVIPTVSEMVEVLGANEQKEEGASVEIISNVRVATKSANIRLLRSLSVALSFIAVGFALLSGVFLWHNNAIWRNIA